VLDSKTGIADERGNVSREQQALETKRALPLNEPVVIEFTPAKSWDIAFACGMNMMKEWSS
jgi:hypothetical protein